MPHLACTKINSKWIKDLNVRAKPIKFLGENRYKLCHLGLDNDFLDMTPRAQGIKEKKDKLGIIKIKNVCASKDTSFPIDGKKIFPQVRSKIYLIRDLYLEYIKSYYNLII